MISYFTVGYPLEIYEGEGGTDFIKYLSVVKERLLYILNNLIFNPECFLPILGPSNKYREHQQVQSASLYKVWLVA